MENRRLAAMALTGLLLALSVLPIAAGLVNTTPGSDQRWLTDLDGSGIEFDEGQAVVEYALNLTGGAFWFDAVCTDSNCPQLDISLEDSQGTTWNGGGRGGGSIRGVAAAGIATLSIGRSDDVGSGPLALLAQEVWPMSALLLGDESAGDAPDEGPNNDLGLGWEVPPALGCLGWGCDWDAALDPAAGIIAGALSGADDVDFYLLPGVDRSVYEILPLSNAEAIEFSIERCGSASGVLSAVNLSASVAGELTERIFVPTDASRTCVVIRAGGADALTPYAFALSTHEPDPLDFGHVRGPSAEGGPGWGPDRTGWVHANESDVIQFWAGMNAPVDINWQTMGDVNITARMFAEGASSAEATTIDIPANESSMRIVTPAHTSATQHVIIEFTFTSEDWGMWQVDAGVADIRDDGALHDWYDTPVVDPGFENTSHGGIHHEIDLLRQTEPQLVIQGTLAAHDPVDAFAFRIDAPDWTTWRIIATVEGEGVEAQLQDCTFENATHYPQAVDTGQTAGLNLSSGHHILLVRASAPLESMTNWTLRVQAINVTPPEDVPLNPDDMRYMTDLFLPFYIAVGIFFLSPLAYVLWTTRGTRTEREVQAHERARLSRLRQQLADLLETEDVDESLVEDSLALIAAVHWRAIEAEMGAAVLTHHTEGVTLKAWPVSKQGERAELLVGVHAEGGAWELAALRLAPVGGPAWRIAKVTPAAMFDGDEIFLGTLKAGSTVFTRLVIEGGAEGLDLHLSGLVEGRPLAAVPAKALLLEEE